jgi:hypothetical protein
MWEILSYTFLPRAVVIRFRALQLFSYLCSSPWIAWSSVLLGFPNGVTLSQKIVASSIFQYDLPNDVTLSQKIVASSIFQ